jgi:predicted TIM-barrel fold metal-dependent hydrolase
MVYYMAGLPKNHVWTMSCLPISSNCVTPSLTSQHHLTIDSYHTWHTSIFSPYRPNNNTYTAHNNITMSSLTTPQAPFIASSEFYLVPANASPTDSSISLVPTPTIAKLRTMNLPRIKDMRATGVTTQIISHVPLYASPQTCVRINDALNAAIYMNPDRFAGMASLPVLDGKEAARELQRCVTKYKFVGGVLALGRGDKIDGDGFEELWAAAERYKVPVAVREVWPSLEQVG